MYAGPMEKYELTFVFSKHSVNSEIWEYLRCGHIYTPTDRNITVRVDLTRGGQRMHADIDSSLHCCVRQLLPHMGAPSSLCYTGPRSPVSPAPPENQTRRHLLHLQRQHLASLWDGAQAFLQDSTPDGSELCSLLNLQVTNPRQRQGDPNSSSPCCLSLCLHNNNS